MRETISTLISSIKRAALPCTIAAALSFAPQRAAGTEQPSQTETAERPNIVLFLIDTLRADRMGLYGYEKPTTPHIDALAGESIVFTRAAAAAPWTLPSVASLMTSKYPLEHRVVVDGCSIAPEATTLAESLKALGYATFSRYANEYAGAASGMTAGFDEATLVTHTGGYEMRQFLQTRANEEPFFLYIHNVEPHNPFDLSVTDSLVEQFGRVGFRERLRMLELYTDFRAATRMGDSNAEENSRRQTEMLKELASMKEDTIDVLYDASVRLADSRVGEVIQALRESGAWENTLFLLVSDHGEEMGEHDGWQHDQSVYAELVHVPFLLRLPAAEHGGQRRDEPVTLVDVMPTLLDFLGAPMSADQASGHSLIPAITNQDGAREDLNQAVRPAAQRLNLKKFYKPFKENRGDLNLVLRQGPWKAIWNVEPDTIELYHSGSDPIDQTDLAGSHPDLEQAFRATIEEQFGALSFEELRNLGGTWNLTPEQTENLRALGYL